MTGKSLALFGCALIFHCSNVENPGVSQKQSATDAGGVNTVALTGVTHTTAEFETAYSVRCADTVSDYTGTELPAFPSAKALGGPTGAGQNAGSLDVFVLGEGKAAVLRAGAWYLENGTGIDFKVFENGFEVSGTPGIFSWDLAWVEVSRDGTNWYGFPLTHGGAPDNQKNGKSGMVGLSPVAVNITGNSMDPRLSAAGGDGFDLSDAKLITARGDGNPLNFTFGAALNENVRYFRISDGGTFLPDDQVSSNGVDIDAICIFHPVNN